MSYYGLRKEDPKAPNLLWNVDIEIWDAAIDTSYENDLEILGKVMCV